MALKGEKLSEETKGKISNAKRGMRFTDEHRKKLSSARRGRIPELGGWHHTDETKEKNRVAKLGNKYHLGKKHTPEARKKMSDARRGKYGGENHPNWQGGKSFEPYGLEFNGSLKERIKKRDNYTCQVCGAVQVRFATHHVDYNKKNNSEENLVCLCNSCHGKTNFNRRAWKAYFNELLSGAGETTIGALVDSGFGEEKVKNPDE